MSAALMTAQPGGYPASAHMDYIKLINRFWKLHSERSFSTGEIALYTHLLDICNGLSWKNPFQKTNSSLCDSLGLSEKTLIAAREVLRKSGLLDFLPGHKRNPTTYRLAAHDTLFSLENELENTLENFQLKLQPNRGLTTPKSKSQPPDTLENVASSLNKTRGKENQTRSGEAAASLAAQKKIEELQKLVAEKEEDIAALKADLDPDAWAPHTGGGAAPAATILLTYPQPLGEDESPRGGFVPPELAEDDPAKYQERPRDVAMVDEFIASHPMPAVRKHVGKGYIFWAEYASKDWCRNGRNGPVPIKDWRSLIPIFQFRESHDTKNSPYAKSGQPAASGRAANLPASSFGGARPGMPTAPTGDGRRN